jgi:HEPN domain-containing protein
MAFARDEGHWLFRLSPEEWIHAALGELSRAEAAYTRGDVRAGLAGLKRAAGMALNGALIVEPNERWGRSYVDHLRALALDAGVPQAVTAACNVLLEAHPPSASLVTLRTARGDQRAIEAAKDVMAHAYAKVKKHEA